MSVQNYPVYQYLKFFWQKKLYLIVFTFLCMAVTAFLSYGKNAVYTSTALVFMGNGENIYLSKPDLIKNRYLEELPEEIVNSFKVDIKGENQITLSLSGENKEMIDEKINKIANLYTDDLTERFNDQKNVTKNYVSSLKDKVENYNNLLEEDQNGEEINRYAEVLINQEQLLESLYKAEKKLIFAEDPELVEITTESTSNNLLRNTVLGGAFGFQLMLVILVLWKYIIDARRSDSKF